MVAGVAFGVNRALAAQPINLIVNSTAWAGADANPGNGVCATSSGTCTLRAAIEESNALKRDPGEVTISVDSSIAIGTDMTGTPNLAANFMYSSRVTREDTYGAQFYITAPVTIDLGHRLRPDASANDNIENALFYINGPDAHHVEILNADNALSSGTSFVVGPTAHHVTINGDTIGNGDGLGQISTAKSYNPERFLVIMQGAEDVTAKNYKINGYYNNNASGGIFLFSNTTDSAPTKATKRVLFDRIQVNYVSGGTCDAGNGTGCNTRIVNFWQNSYDGLSGLGYQNNTIDTLTFNDMVVRNMSSTTGMYGFDFAYPSGTTSTYTADITNLSITNSQFLNNAVWLTTEMRGAFIHLPFLDHLHGTTTISNNVFTTNHTASNQSGEGTAIFVLGNEPANSTNPSGVTIANNYFNGYGNYGVIRTRSTGLVTVTGNTFGPATDGRYGAATSGANTEDLASNYVMYSQSTDQVARAANESVQTWTPQESPLVPGAANSAKVLTVEKPAGAVTMVDPRGGASPTCPVVVKAVKPTSAYSASYTVPRDTVTLQAYWTSGQTAEVYLGQVTGLSGPDATLIVPLPIGEITLPDGVKRTPVNPTTGQTNGYVRLQTQVEPLGQLESSQYSKILKVDGTCQPILTINQAVGMVDPTYGRDLHFTLKSTIPLDPSTVSAADINLTATPVAATIDPARLNPRVVSVTLVEGSSNTEYDIVVRVDDSAKVTVGVPSNSVTTEAGLTNTAPASSVDNNITYLNPLRVDPPVFTLVTGEPKGQVFKITIASAAPQPTADLAFDATLEQPVGAPDVFLSTYGPVIRAGQFSSNPVTVTAAEGAVSANTAVPITLTVASSDSNYDGLVVPTVEPRLFSTDPNIQITKQAYISMTDSSTLAGILGTGDEVLKGERLLDGEPVCFVYTVTNTSPDDWPTVLTDITVTDTDKRLGTDGVIGTIRVLERGHSVQLFSCAVLIPKDTTADDGGTSGGS